MKKIILSLATISLLASCGGKEETTEQEHNETTENVESTESTETKENNASGTYNVVDGSTITWEAKHYKDTAYVHKGTVAMTQGNVIVENSAIIGGRFEFDMSKIIEPGTDTTQPWTLQGHFPMPDFFDAGTFALADFTIISMEGNNVTGTLNLKGVSQELTFPVEVEVTDNEVHAKGSTELNLIPHNIELINKNEEAPEEEKMEGPNPVALISFDLTATKAAE